MVITVLYTGCVATPLSQRLKCTSTKCTSADWTSGSLDSGHTYTNGAITEFVCGAHEVAHQATRLLIWQYGVEYGDYDVALCVDSGEEALRLHNNYVQGGD